MLIVASLHAAAPEPRRAQTSVTARDLPPAADPAPRTDLVQLLVGAIEDAPAHRERLIAHAAEDLEQAARNVTEFIAMLTTSLKNARLSQSRGTQRMCNKR